MEGEDCDGEMEAAVGHSSVIFSPRTAMIIKKGILSKKGTGLLYKPWSQRMLTIDTDHRLSYLDVNTFKIRGSFLLGGTVISLIDAESADGRLHAFQISNITWNKGTSRMILAASSASEAGQWVSCLNLAAQSISTTTTVPTIAATKSMDYVSLKDLKASFVDKFPHAFEFDDDDRDEVDEEEEEDQNGHVI
eukprot:gene32293-41850_t